MGCSFSGFFRRLYPIPPETLFAGIGSSFSYDHDKELPNTLIKPNMFAHQPMGRYISALYGSQKNEYASMSDDARSSEDEVVCCN